MLNSSGTKTKEYEYNAFGKIDVESNINTSNPWQYCGEYKDSETGLIYLRNRYYDPETGRFINEDPIRSGGNWYSYASQNPVMFFDMFGLATEYRLNVPAFDQSMPETCALANVSMVIAYYAKDNINRESQIKEAMGTYNTRQYIERVNYNIGIDENNMYKNDKLELGDNIKIPAFVVDSTSKGKFDYQKVKGELDAGNPVIALYESGSYGHFITIIGYIEDDDGKTYIIYNDSDGGVEKTVALEDMDSYKFEDGHSANYSKLYVASKPQENEEEI